MGSDYVASADNAGEDDDNCHCYVCGVLASFVGSTCGKRVECQSDLDDDDDNDDEYFI